MGRLAHTVRWDITLQARNGFYLVTGLVLLIWAALLIPLPALDTEWLLPPLILSNLVVGGFYFVGAIVLLEKAEGSLLARAVTPLRGGEYLAARVISLSLLALVENLGMAALFRGAGFNPLPMAGGVVLGTALFCLAGLITVAPYGSINAYMLPSAAVAGLLALPTLSALARWESPLRYLHPLEPAMLLMQGAFRPLSAGELAYCLIAGALWTIALGRYALRACRRLTAEA
ncbi:ABC transporter permease [Oscillochloris sp. ZM17-4]|uniref:fluoroquinolone export ABC transporter permease subunit n=1 Tax=Oscillochloris sp. ZM17-4 TaxID=2866714 RepID=UPI001C73A6C0|nr:ABC transporter permease [Oscillochloris sp. ZM17-4]MBX0326657.1 ABC transporter permease [Oscillochloris sp. ZM17-4]